MLAFGTGMLPMHSVRRGRSPATDRSALPLVNLSIELGFTHIDTSEMYPGFDDLRRVLRPHRHKLFVTSKVDPTLAAAATTCKADGAGCRSAMLAAANATRRRLGMQPDLLLLHRPPSRQAGGRTLGGAAQCVRLRESWRGLESAHRRGLAKAIGLSNVCGAMLRCLANTAKVPPAVLQYMHHVGMGADRLGYRAFGQRTWGSQYMAYSVLGGAEQQFDSIMHAVASVALAHGNQAAGVAMSWVAQQQMPMVLITARAAHMRQNLRVYDADPPWGRLSVREMDALSAVRDPTSRPSYWGDCDDAPPEASKTVVTARRLPH